MSGEYRVVEGSIPSGQSSTGPIAQLVEQPTHNRQVVGSNPARPTIFSFDHLEF